MTPYATAVCGALVRAYRGRNAARRLARDAGASYRTACNWLAGLNAPSGDALITLMAQCDELMAEINQLVRERKQK